MLFIFRFLYLCYARLILILISVLIIYICAMLGAPRQQTHRPSGWPQVRSVWRWSMKIVTETKNNINSMYVQVLGLHVDKLVWPCWGRLSWCWRRRKPAWPAWWRWNPMGPRAAGEDKGGASHPTPDPWNPHQQIMSMSRCENSI